MGEIYVTPASALAEAERIVRATREKIEAVREGGRQPSAEQTNALAKREAIAAIVKQYVIDLAPLN